jgi:hypothetical protein
MDLNHDRIGLIITSLHSKFKPNNLMCESVNILRNLFKFIDIQPRYYTTESWFGSAKTNYIVSRGVGGGGEGVLARVAHAFLSGRREL